MSDFTFALDLPPGLNSDDTSFAAAGRWVDGNDIRFVQGRPESVGGSSGPLNGEFSDPRKLLAYFIGTTVRVAIAGAVLNSVIVGGPNFDITPIGWTSSFARGHCFAMWGDVLLVSNSGGKLFQSVAGAVATHITQAPSQITAMLVTPQRQVLALGCNEESSGTFNGLCIRGCDLEDLTDWTSTPTNNAFEHVLHGSGSIVAARLVGPYVAVWTTTSLYLGQFIGEPGQTYRFDLVAENCGCVGLDAVAIAGQAAYWMGPDLQLRVWTPGGLPQIITCPIGRDYRENCSVEHKARIHACHFSRFDEIWFYYPDSRDSAAECSRYIAYCIGESAAWQRPVWFRGVRSRATLLDSPLLAQDLSGPGTTIIGAAGGGGASLQADDCDTSAPPDWSIQSSDQYVDSGRRRVQVQRVVPDFAQHSGLSEVRLHMRDRPQSVSRSKDPYPFFANTQRIDLLASAMLVAFKFSGTGKVRFGKPMLEGKILGSR